ncbi:MAG: hypothetical protein HC906_16685 [Bacteroidales bacterium]|nr:hypothetical protein [Bacteroidales bacterium]
MEKLYSLNRLKLTMGIFAIVLCFLSTALYSQRVVQVEPGLYTLTEAISADTLPDGSRVDSNTVYELERGDNKIYILNGEISNIGYHLTIRAEAGDGKRPYLVPGVPAGGESSAPLRPKGDVTLKGLHITNRDINGKINERAIRCSADDIRVDVDDCWINESSQSCFRLDNPGIKIYVKIQSSAILAILMTRIMEE